MDKKKKKGGGGGEGEASRTVRDARLKESVRPFPFARRESVPIIKQKPETKQFLALPAERKKKGEDRSSLDLAHPQHIASKCPKRPFLAAITQTDSPHPLRILIGSPSPPPPDINACSCTVSYYRRES